MSEGHQGGGTPGGKLGCLSAALVGAPVFSLLMLADALGDCAPGIDCHKGFLRYVLAPTIIVGILVGLLALAMMDRFKRNDS